MKVGVWVDATVFLENSAFYQNMLNLEVDFLLTDYPFVAQQVRDEWMRRVQTPRQAYQEKVCKI